MYHVAQLVITLICFYQFCNHNSTLSARADTKVIIFILEKKLELKWLKFWKLTEKMYTNKSFVVLYRILSRYWKELTDLSNSWKFWIIFRNKICKWIGHWKQIPKSGFIFFNKTSGFEPYFHVTHLSLKHGMELNAKSVDSFCQSIITLRESSPM